MSTTTPRRTLHAATIIGLGVVLSTAGMACADKPAVAPSVPAEPTSVKLHAHSGPCSDRPATVEQLVSTATEAKLGVQGKGITLAIHAPTDFELAEHAPWELCLNVAKGNGAVHLASRRFKGKAPAGQSMALDLELEVDEAAVGQTGVIDVRLRTVVCDAIEHSACYPIERRIELPFTIEAGAKQPSVQAVLGAPSA